MSLKDYLNKLLPEKNHDPKKDELLLALKSKDARKVAIIAHELELFRQLETIIRGLEASSRSGKFDIEKAIAAAHAQITIFDQLDALRDTKPKVEEKDEFISVL